MRRAGPGIFIVFLAAVSAHAADVSVKTRHQGSAIIVEASADVPGRAGQAWTVLTDYERLSSFIPNMESSRVVARGRAGLVIEQKGVARFLVFSYPIEVRLAVSEFPPNRIEAQGAGGSFKEFRGVYNLSVAQGRTRLHYVCEMVPDFFVPPIIGTAILQRNVEESFGALVDEIVRQHDAPGMHRESRADGARRAQ